MNVESPSKETHQKSQPSCELCQRRKVRCDKGNPCTTCRRAGVKCEVISRPRLPRGRNGGRRKGDSDLKGRIAKLESLVSSLGGSTTPGGASPSANPGHVQHEEAPQQGPGDMSRYLGSSFWSNLSSEVHGLREVLDDKSDSDSETPERSEPAASPPGINSQGFNFVLCGPDTFMLSPNALDTPSRHMIEIYHSIYFENVHPLFKVLHAPTFTDFLLHGKPYLDHKPGDPAVEALSYAIYYAGIVTLDEWACKQRLGEEKNDLLNRYRFAIEVCFAKADFITSNDITVLQALIIFLAAARQNDRSRWTWTLLALALRISQALGLHASEGPSSLKPFQLEMRRRLWRQLGILDINAAIDRGTEPMMAGRGYGVNPPANVNDVDISPEMTGPIIARTGFTDMSFCLMSHDGEPLIRELIYVQGGDDPDERSRIEQTWYKRQETVLHFKRTLHNKYLQYCDMDNPFQWFAKCVGEVMSLALMLFAVRPMQLHPSIKAPQSADSSVLNLAIDCLRKHREILTDPRTEPWRWFAWVQWHPLAVALAELCSRTEGPVVDRAWEVVDDAFQRYSQKVADTEKGMLWQPIEKLMKKARQNRRMAQMANLNLHERGEPVTINAQNSDTFSGFSTINPPLQQQGYVPTADAMSRTQWARSTGLWNVGVLGPGSMSPTPAVTQNSIDGLASAAELGSIPLAFEPPKFGGTQDAGFPLDMAWTNWGDFVGDVNYADVEM